MQVDYKEPASETTVEVKINKSRFLGHVRICRSEEEVRMKLKEVCDLHKQATHNCWAYRIGEESYREYFSDDGEPAGTAGKPILGAISRLDLTNALIVVTRYFGGIKLGVRGLIEAYGSTATNALNAPP
nr:YigZ family protein [Synergistaceae bacterium]